MADVPAQRRDGARSLCVTQLPGSQVGVRCSDSGSFQQLPTQPTARGSQAEGDAPVCPSLSPPGTLTSTSGEPGWPPPLPGLPPGGGEQVQPGPPSAVPSCPALSWGGSLRGDQPQVTDPSATPWAAGVTGHCEREGLKIPGPRAKGACAAPGPPGPRWLRPREGGGRGEQLGRGSSALSPKVRTFLPGGPAS